MGEFVLLLECKYQAPDLSSHPRVRVKGQDLCVAA